MIVQVIVSLNVARTRIPLAILKHTSALIINCGLYLTRIRKSYVLMI